MWINYSAEKKRNGQSLFFVCVKDRLIFLKAGNHTINKYFFIPTFFFDVSTEIKKIALPSCLDYFRWKISSLLV